MPATVFGVPTHPLTVHAAVVLVPLAVIAVVVAALWPAARRRYGPVVLILATLALVVRAGRQGERGEPGPPAPRYPSDPAARGDGRRAAALGRRVVDRSGRRRRPALGVVAGHFRASLDRIAAFGPRSGVRGRPGRHRRVPRRPSRRLAPGPEPLLPGPGPAGTRGGRLVSRLAGAGVAARSRPGLRRLPRGDAGSGSQPRLWRWSPQWGRRQRSSASAIRGPKQSGPGRQPPPRDAAAPGGPAAEAPRTSRWTDSRLAPPLLMNRAGPTTRGAGDPPATRGERLCT